MKTRSRFLFHASIMMLLLLVGSARSRTSDAEEKTIFICHLNFDCYPDTVKGENSGENGYLPSRILWGEGNKPDLPCDGKTPPHKRVKQTRFVYPGWKIAGVSVAFQDISGDSLADIILHIKAVIPGDEHETLRSIVLFGQHAINGVPAIHIGDIGRFQAEPFFAMELVRGAELTRAGKRDLSGATSYILEPVDLNLDGDDSIPPPIAPLAGVDQRKTSVLVYPNPAANTLRIEGTELAAGDYILQVISANGNIELREEVAVTPGKELRKTLNLQRFATGYYVVRIESGEGIIGTWPVVITH